MSRRLWVAGGLAFVVIIVIAAILLAIKEQEHTATVVEITNKVEAHPHPKDEWFPAIKDMTIYGGGQVRTLAESAARMELLEGIVRLSADSIFTVKESVTCQGTLLTSLFLQDGRLWIRLTTDQPHEFRVETGNAVAAVRDTHFSIRATEGETLVSVAEGEVELTAEGQSVTVAAEEQATVKPDQPPSPPEPMSDIERHMWATEGETPELAPPIGKVDTGMGGSLTIRGTVRDSSEAVAPDVYVSLTAYLGNVGEDIREVWNGKVITDEAGEYAFNNLPRVMEGHYQVWFSSPQGFERMYEGSGYYINENEIRSSTYSLNITVHPVTGSALSGVIQYEDTDGVTKNYLSSPIDPDHFIELNRGTADNIEYTVGFEGTIEDGGAMYIGNLAGGTYYFIFQYTRSDGVRVGCESPSIIIPTGKIKQFDYTIPLSSCNVME